MVQVNQDSFKLSGTPQLLVYANNNVVDGSAHTIKKNTEVLVTAGIDTGTEVNAEETRCMVMSRDQNAG